MSVLLDERTRVLVVGASGRQAQRHVPFMRAYGTRVVAGVAPGRRTDVEAGYPIFDSVAQAIGRVGGIDLAVLFVPAPHALSAAAETIGNGIATTVVLAEGVPFRDSIELTSMAAERGLRIIGPNCQGIISPGRAKVGASGGKTPQRMFRPGRVGVVSRSGGMGAETCWLLSRAGIGQSTYVSIGGEAITGARFPDIARLFDADDETDAIVCFGEPGTEQEEMLAQDVASGAIRKPVFAYITGDFVEQLGTGRSFGHAGAVIGSGSGSPSGKRERLRAAGVHVARRWADLPALVRDVAPACAQD
ncbi:MAG TPA: CoA-binding protein [Casimicrobiaceae bacterium]|nr:CoA-binding protein [Casimicrobiaceae bacterium]